MKITGSNYQLIARELLWGVMLVFIGTQFFLVLLSFLLPSSVLLPESFFFLVLFLISFLASFIVILVGRTYWRRKSFLLTFLFSMLFITVYASIIDHKFGHFVPELNESAMPFIWIGYYTLPVIGAVIGFNLRAYKEMFNGKN